MEEKTVNTPQYLARPRGDKSSFGELIYDEEGDRYVIQGEPYVFELAKRIFPGSQARDGSVVFKVTRRAVGELNWLMLRFPLNIQNPKKYEEHRQSAVRHAAVREEFNNIPPAKEEIELFRGKLLPFQRSGVEFLVNNERTTLADMMGLGKTVQAIASLAKTQEFPALVVCPANIVLQWEKMIRNFMRLGRKQGPDRKITILKGLTPYEVPKSSIYIIHYGLLRGWRNKLLELGLKTVIFDEGQELRHTGTEKYSVASLLSGACRFVWVLSGTPIYNYGNEIWSVMNIVDYHCLGDSDSFSREWCMGYQNKIIAKPEVLGDYLRREGLMLRRRLEDVQSELPEKRRAVVVVGKDEDTYNRLIKRAVGLARGYKNMTEWSAKGRAVRDMENEARKATGISKAACVADFVDTLLDAGEKVLLFAYHHDVHEILRIRLARHNPVQITGRQSGQEKDDAIKQFASGQTPLVQLSLRSAAGLDGLQGMGTCIVFAELDWSPAVMGQCESRLHRFGFKGKESLLCYYLVCDTGSDETIQDALGLKIGQFVGLMGDKAESAADRNVSTQVAQDHLKKLIAHLAK